MSLAFALVLALALSGGGEGEGKRAAYTEKFPPNRPEITTRTKPAVLECSCGIL